MPRVEVGRSERGRACDYGQVKAKQEFRTPSAFVENKKAFLLGKALSPEVGFEPTTNGLTVRCSTAELFRNNGMFGMIGP